MGGSSGTWAPGDNTLNSVSNQYLNTLDQIQPYALNYATGSAQTYGNLANQITNNPYAAAGQTNANNISSLAQGSVAPTQLGGMSALSGLGALAASYAPQIMQTAMDPQNALYNRTAQQLTDQSNATNAMYGLSSSPYGANLTNQALSNFNIDWQNNQLSRELQGITGLGNLTNTANTAYSGASTLGTNALDTLGTAGQAGYNYYLNNIGNQISGLNAIGSGINQSFAPVQQNMGDMLSYLQYGTGAQGQQAQTSSDFWSSLGSGLSGLFGAASNPTSLFGYSLW